MNWWFSYKFDPSMVFVLLYSRATIHKSFSQITATHDYAATYGDYTLSRSLGDSLLSRNLDPRITKSISYKDYDAWTEGDSHFNFHVNLLSSEIKVLFYQNLHVTIPN
jgi:hypothetical protein